MSNALSIAIIVDGNQQMIPFDKIYSNENFVIFKFSSAAKDQDKFQISIKNPFDQIIRYSVYYQSNSFSPLISNESQSVMISSGKKRVFELNTIPDLKVNLRLMVCYGEPVVKFFRSLQDLEKGLEDSVYSSQIEFGKQFHIKPTDLKYYV